MLPTWLTRLVLAVAFTVLPLQGLAETVQVLLCQPQSATAAVHDDHRHDGAGAHPLSGPHDGHEAAHAGHGGVAHEGADASTSHHAAVAAEAPDDGHTGHFCCDVVAAWLTGSAPSIAHFDFPALEPARDVERASIVLEYPQRPPLV